MSGAKEFEGSCRITPLAVEPEGDVLVWTVRVANHKAGGIHQTKQRIPAGVTKAEQRQHQRRRRRRRSRHGGKLLNRLCVEQRK